MFFNTRIYLYIVIGLLLISCENNTNIKSKNAGFSRKSNIKYAQYFNIQYFNDYKVIKLINPWNKNSEYFKYYVYYNKKELKHNTNSIEMSIIKKNIVALSASQIGFLNKLKLSKYISAVSKKEYIYNKDIISGIETNEIIELGDESNLNFEKLLNIKPNIVFTTGWKNNNQLFNKIINSEIPVVYLLEWQENTPLGRAEWIKFIAAFFNKEKEADSIFSIIEKKYNKLKQKKYNTKPSVLHGSLIGGTWYIPGGNSYVSNFYKDAGANYLWKDIDKETSIPLKFESVFSKAKDVNFWFPMINISSTKELIRMENRYKLFKPIENKKIFLSNKRQNKYGGNDYWESGVVNPDRILNDLVNIFHKDSLKNNDLIYFSIIN